MAERSLDLRMAFVPDEDKLSSSRLVPLDLAVNLRHQRTDRVIGDVAAAPGVGDDLRRYAVGGEDHDRPGGHLVEFLDEDRPFRFEGADNVEIVNDRAA